MLSHYSLLLALLLARLDVIERGFGAGIQSIYFSGFLGLGVLVNVVVATSIKRIKKMILNYRGCLLNKQLPFVKVSRLPYFLEKSA